MPARTGEQYIKGLQQQEREIWLGGERVKDVTTHPGLANGVRSVAALYDMQHDPTLRDEMTYVSPTTGDRVGRRCDGGARAGHARAAGRRDRRVLTPSGPSYRAPQPVRPQLRDPVRDAGPPLPLSRELRPGALALRPPAGLALRGDGLR